MDCALGSIGRKGIHTSVLCLSLSGQKHLWSQLCPQAPAERNLPPRWDFHSRSRWSIPVQIPAGKAVPGAGLSARGWREPILSSQSITEEGLQAKGYFPFSAASRCDHGTGHHFLDGFKFPFQVAAVSDLAAIAGSQPQHPRVPPQVLSFSSWERVPTP